MGYSWKEDRAKERIEMRFEEVRRVEIVDYKRDMSLECIPAKKAYRMDAVHLYIDIVNLDEILTCTSVEGETCHKRTLRFLNQHYRAVHRIILKTDAIRVDFHNQRLHAVVAKPYGEDSERDRVAHAVAIAQLAADVLAETGDDDAQIPNAKVRVGIDSGRALVVNNGRRGGREPLFLGHPANHAAKCASAGTAEGIYLTNTARAVMGFPVLATGKDRTTALTADQIDTCVTEADLGVSKEQIIKVWREEQEETPIGSIDFSRPTPPLSNLDFDLLSVSKTKRFEGVSVYADVDGFSAYVDKHLDDNPEDLVRTLHVIRSELDAVTHKDFSGRRLRFIGDCLHGLTLEGTAQTTEVEATISTATLCAGALRSSFACAIAHLHDEGVDTDDLGLAIGFELGPLSVTRLGMKGSMLRCATGRAILKSEEEQRRCTGTETAIGPSAYAAAPSAVRTVFGSSRKADALDYDTAVTELAASGDRVAKGIQSEAYAATAPAVVPTLSQPLRPHTAK
ncbi:MAG: transcriptional regulator [Comamonas sp. SCN 65-56]|uniref:adenylate/guanylate cyclase domain-containing protein n=1 Tax=Comamonas sp. SCN 65-56 TaxID=1660095 RepID=UPI00086A8545|nr:adenylate/guanylate cyclase domain-containing protein [Comamonas sp. SCN 65-56]ODS90375.1 MAG: transcriptional regulator [Comamonas sp. SCN 65-56]